VTKIPVDDPWKRISVRPTPAHFGRGSRHDFRWYFEGDSRHADSGFGGAGELRSALRYVPHCAVDHEFRTVAFAGYILEVQRRRQQRTRR
jgi:hypothetical protein